MRNQPAVRSEHSTSLSKISSQHAAVRSEEVIEDTVKGRIKTRENMAREAARVNIGAPGAIGFKSH
jgi:hypothetical protein